VGSIAIYLVSFWFITYYSAEADDFGIFVELFVNLKTYISLAFFMSSYVLVDSGMRFTSIEVKSMSDRRKTRALYEAKLKEIEKMKKDTSIKIQIKTIKSKLSVYFTQFPLFRPWLCFLWRGRQRQTHHRVAHEQTAESVFQKTVRKSKRCSDLGNVDSSACSASITRDPRERILDK